jgi:CheY-like chemotaxis protein
MPAIFGRDVNERGRSVCRYWTGNRVDRHTPYEPGILMLSEPDFMPHGRQQSSPIVLLVQSPHDDSREMYAEFFRHHDLTVRCPEDVDQALDLASSADVIITGLQLPGTMDGYAFIQRLRADERTRRKPIIVVTSWAWQTERLRAEEAGCDLFLTKPCLPDVLLRHVRRALTTTRLRGGDDKSLSRQPPRPKRHA